VASGVHRKRGGVFVKKRETRERERMKKNKGGKSFSPSAARRRDFQSGFVDNHGDGDCARQTCRDVTRIVGFR